eukprot:SAG11_NODE_647_length_7957_cov_2.900903_5_plen_87_part_00
MRSENAVALRHTLCCQLEGICNNTNRSSIEADIAPESVSEFLSGLSWSKTLTLVASICGWAYLSYACPLKTALGFFKGAFFKGLLS